MQLTDITFVATIVLFLTVPTAQAFGPNADIRNLMDDPVMVMMQHKVSVNLEAPPCSSVDCEVDAKLGGKVHVQRHHSAKDLAEIKIRERMQDYDGDHSKAPTEIQNGESMQDYDGDHAKALTEIQNGESMQDYDGDHSKALTEIQIGESMQDYDGDHSKALTEIQNGESMQDHDGDHSKAPTEIQIGESMQDYDGDHSKALTEIQNGESMQASEPVSLLQIDDPRQRALNLLRDRARSTHSEKLAKMAQELAAHVDDPLAEVNNKIENIIFTLKSKRTDEDYDGNHSEALAELQNRESTQGPFEDYDGDHAKVLAELQNRESTQDYDGDHAKALAEIQNDESMQV